MSTAPVIVDRFAEVVASMRNLSAADAAKFGITYVNDQGVRVPGVGLESPYYFYGSPIEVNKQLIRRDEELSSLGKVYPAIVLRLPSVETPSGGLMKYNLNVAIFEPTQDTYDSVDRYTNVIKPTLIPLYNLLIDRLKKAHFFWPGDQRIPPHEKIDRLHHGVEETQGNKAYAFAHKLDAIELVNLKINSSLKYC